MTISDDINNLRRQLLRYIDGDEKLELHLNAKEADTLVIRLETLMWRVEAMEKQIVPPHLTAPEVKTEGNVVQIADFRKKPATGGAA